MNYKHILSCFGLVLSIVNSNAQTQLRTLGNKSYEVSNHLGNVMVVVSDRKTRTPVTTNTIIAFNETDIKAFNDYYPYGMLLENRNVNSNYRFGFQDQEKDDEVKGKNNSINYKYRVHDPRLGRFFAVDLLTGKYPYYSSYNFSGNRVIDSYESIGKEGIVYNHYKVAIDGTRTLIKSVYHPDLNDVLNSKVSEILYFTDINGKDFVFKDGDTREKGNRRGDASVELYKAHQNWSIARSILNQKTKDRILTTMSGTAKIVGGTLIIVGTAGSASPWVISGGLMSGLYSQSLGVTQIVASAKGDQELMNKANNQPSSFISVFGRALEERGGLKYAETVTDYVNLFLFLRGTSPSKAVKKLNLTGNAATKWESIFTAAKYGSTFDLVLNFTGVSYDTYSKYSKKEKEKIQLLVNDVDEIKKYIKKIENKNDD